MPKRTHRIARSALYVCFFLFCIQDFFISFFFLPDVVPSHIFVVLPHLVFIFRSCPYLFLLYVVFVVLHVSPIIILRFLFEPVERSPR